MGYAAPDYALNDASHYTDNENRQQLLAVISVFEQSLLDIVDYMESAVYDYDDGTNLWDDTLLVFSSDNGVSTQYGGSNFPLRGGKKTLWEGGIKAAAFINGGWLPNDRRGQKMNALMHVTDWLPTLCGIAEHTPSGSYSLDGYDQ